ncbi:probable histone-lysine N-methyltransferase PRDM7 [Sturnira hondurensis]|uniref:probable histone-lysine N-methyltransferase PRDM7 n=1 Tax=Sturnira hondurensis TaxID=192404 RepID=UPI00187A6596|nr:probable histone-lysine N-methyltransferase PRDM7 [Sturnira hondurensis]
MAVWVCRRPRLHLVRASPDPLVHLRALPREKRVSWGRHRPTANRSPQTPRPRPAEPTLRRGTGGTAGTGRPLRAGASDLRLDTMHPDRYPQHSPKGEAGKMGQKPQAEEALKDVSVYFSREEWAEMGDWEKGRYQNLKRNFEVLLSLGPRAPPPAFICHRRQATELQEEDPEDSDEEWTPRRQGEGREEPELPS